MPICHIYDKKNCFLSHISDFISCDIGIAFAFHSLIVFITRNKNPNAAKALLGIFKEIYFKQHMVTPVPVISAVCQ